MTIIIKTPLASLIPLLLIAGCSSQAPNPKPQQTQPPIKVVQSNQNATQTIKRPSTGYTPSDKSPATSGYPAQSNSGQTNAGYQSFYDWKADFSRRAIAKGHSAYDVKRLLDMAQYNSQVVSLDSSQAEFVKMPWEYVESAVSDAKIRKGRTNYAEQASLFSQISNQYNVSPHTVAAIWGMESAYGAVTGHSNLASSLATLAYEGRRRQFAEEQLMALLTLLNRGDVYWSNLTGSWAGGMGQTQFIPATWLSQGVDGNGDGFRNPWSTADSLSSTANYLSNSGWIYGLDPIYEIQLPVYFDYTQTGMTKSFTAWQQLGIQLLDNRYLNASTPMTLWLPAGKDGPALLLTKNFDVIKVYNNSSSYALGVSLLAKAIAQQGGLQKSWPKYERPLSKYQVRQLQQRLTDAGYDTKGVDGVIGSNTRKAFQRWQADNHQVADGFICQRTANALIW